MKYYYVQLADRDDFIAADHVYRQGADVVFTVGSEIITMLAAGYWLSVRETDEAEYDKYMARFEQSEGGVH